MPTANNRRGLADSWNIGNVLLYNDRDTMMIDKVVRDYAGEQIPNGDFPACQPGAADSMIPPIPEWSMYWPMLLWQQYLFSGDETLLREMSPRLTHFLDWIKTYQDPTNQTAQSSRMADFRLCRRQHAQRRLQHRHRLPIL